MIAAMSGGADARLDRLLGGDQLAGLRKRLRQRFERAPIEGAIDTMRIGDLTAEEHAALVALVGRPQRQSESLQIDVRLIDAALQRAEIAPSLRHALEQLDGPIIHRATARRQQEIAWSEVIGGCRHPRMTALLQTSAGLALLKRLAGQSPTVAARLCHSADAVLERLPAPCIPRSQLAASVLGDAHALDDGRGTAALVLAVWRRVIPAEQGEAGAESLESGEEQERGRAVWARAGVLVNELARPALFLNLPTRDANGHGGISGEPAYASLRSLLRSPPFWDVAGRDVFVCENPNVVAIAADRLGSCSAPLVCTDGMPSAAQRCLLSQLAEAGARLLYHGDFDWPGIRIGNQVMQGHGARPWRFGAADYRAAVCAGSAAEHRLAGKPVTALWDEGLSHAMQEHQISIAEEALADSLLEDIGDR